MWCVEHTDEHPAIRVEKKDGRSVARWLGLMTCGHIWTCPVCSQNKRARRVERIVAALEELGGEWVMLTVTLRHRQGLALRELVRGMMAAWRRTRQGGKVQSVWSARVSASVRSLEVTYGENGWHPHVHVLLRTKEWTDEEREALQNRWEVCIVRELGEHVRPDDLHGLKWSRPIDASKSDERHRARYLAKAGLEVGGVAKEGRRGSLSPWDIARAAAAGDSRSFWLWREFYDATKGRRAIELDDRAAAAAKRNEEKKKFDVDCEERIAPVRIEVKRDDVRALRKWERGLGSIMAVVLRAAEEGGELAVRQWVDAARARMARLTPQPHATSPPVHHGTIQ